MPSIHLKICHSQSSAKQEESAVKRIKLEYDEMKPNQREVMEVWEMLTSKESGRMKCDNQMLLHAIRQGTVFRFISNLVELNI